MPSKVFYEQGRYWGRITRQRLGKSSNGNPQLTISFVVMGKVNPMDPDGDLQPVIQQYERTVYRVVTDKTIDWVVQDLDKLGWSGTDWNQFDEQTPGCCDIRGTEHAFSCKHEPHYETGEPREVWSVAQENAGPMILPLEPAEVRKLNALFGKALKGRKPQPEAKPAATKAVPAPPPAPQGEGLEQPVDDGIPF